MVRLEFRRGPAPSIFMSRRTVVDDDEALAMALRLAGMPSSEEMRLRAVQLEGADDVVVLNDAEYRRLVDAFAAIERQREAACEELRGRYRRTLIRLSPETYEAARLVACSVAVLSCAREPGPWRMLADELTREPISNEGGGQ